jgi:quercetin dioxygenase-like cupin family protein
MNTSSPKPEIIKLVDLLAYQEQAIVSRTLLRTPSGNVTVFAFDAGESLSEHTAPHEALILGIEGEGVITLSGEQFRLQPGEMIRLPANQPHAVLATERFKMLLIMFLS